MTHSSDTPATPLILQDSRLRPPLQAHYPGTDTKPASWRAVAFRAGHHDLLIAASALRAVIASPTAVTGLPDSVAWFSGLATTEHGVIAVTDLAGFIAETSEKRQMAGQLLLLQSPLANTALFVDKVYGLQRVMTRPSSTNAALPDELTICCSATVMHQQTVWPLLNPFKLSCNRRFIHITAD